MNIVIVGGVAAGTKAAAKLKRENPGAQVTIYTRSLNISYAGCGLPYFVGDVIHDEAELIVNTPERFFALTGVNVKCGTEMTSLDRKAKQIRVHDLKTDAESIVSYDILILATGADAVRPPLPGADLQGVYVLRTPEDAVSLREAVDAGMKRAVVVGGGFIGLETAENLRRKNVMACVLEMSGQILPGFDPDFAEYLEDALADAGIPVFTGEKVTEICGAGKVEKVKSSTRAMKADAVIFAVGIRPNTSYLKDSGILLAPNGTVLVDEQMRTNDPDIYAVGDCACVKNSLTQEQSWSPMGSSANIEGRLAAGVICGQNHAYRGVLGTMAVKLCGINAAKTGMSHGQAVAAGYDACSVVAVLDDKAHYYPGASSFVIRLTCDRKSRRLLGLQVAGSGSVDKIADIGATALTLNATLDQLENMDLAYAPPFSTAIHPFSAMINILNNKLQGALCSAVWDDLEDISRYTILDVAAAPSIPNARHVDYTELNGPLPDIPLDTPLLLVCAKGKRAYLTQNVLKRFGYQNTMVLEGGSTFHQVKL